MKDENKKNNTDKNELFRQIQSKNLKTMWDIKSKNNLFNNLFSKQKWK